MFRSDINLDEYKQQFKSYVSELRERSDPSKTNDFAELRGIKLSTVEDAGIFYIDNSVEMMIPRYIQMLDSFGMVSPTNKKPIYHQRYIIPIYDIDGSLLNLVGYSDKQSERYIYGTSLLYRRRDDMWGMEKLHEAYRLGYAILTEGITDALTLRDMGYTVAFANCGTHESQNAIRQLNRCRHGVIIIPDRDPAGQRAVKKWKFNRSITINTFIQYKDVDEMVHKSVNGAEWVTSYIEDAIRWIKQKEHMGMECEKVEITMY